MSQALKERLKNLVIFTLIVTGIIQVGILFGYQNEGTPTNLFLGLLNRTPKITDELARDSLFQPDRLILSDGEKKYWVVGKSSANYVSLWDEAKMHLRDIADEKVSLKATNEDWGELTEKKGIFIDFGYTMKPDLLKWFLGSQVSGNNLPDFRKIMIKPDIVDSNTGLIYIYAANDRVYVTDTIIFGKAVDIDKTYNSVENSDIRVYNSFRGDNIDKSLNSPPDVLYVNGNPRYWPYYNYSCKIPSRAQNKEDLAAALLGNDKGRYDLSIGIDDTVQFSWTNNNIYRLYSDGCLTYQYLDTTGTSQKNSVGSALLNAYKFVDRVRQLSDSSANLKLSAITEVENRPGVYNISFDYSLDDMPVRIDMETQAANVDNNKLVHAVDIQADSTRVLKCVSLLRDFNRIGKQNYNDRFIELMSLKGGRAFDQLQINDLQAGYFIKTAKELTLKPNLLIALKDNSGIQVEMQAEKGD